MVRHRRRFRRLPICGIASKASCPRGTSGASVRASSDFRSRCLWHRPVADLQLASHLWLYSQHSFWPQAIPRNDKAAMLRFLRRRKLQKRAIQYLSGHPEDEPAVKAILMGVEALGISSAREAAETTAGRPLSDDEWNEYGPRWERAWNFMIR